MRRFFCVVALAAFLIPPAGLAGEAAPSREELKKLVLEVIRENPQVVYEAYEAQNRKLAAEKKKLAQANDLENRVQDRIPPGAAEKGAPNAPVTIINYLDYECGYCSRGDQTLAQVMGLYPGKVRVVVKNFPLAMHKNAMDAAKAALAAQKQGKFWQYQALLFQNRGGLGDALYVSLAKRLGMDADRFNRDRKSPEIEDRIAADMEDFHKAGLQGTPQFIVNGVKIRGAQPLERFKEVIDKLLAEQKK